MAFILAINNNARLHLHETFARSINLAITKVINVFRDTLDRNFAILNNLLNLHCDVNPF